MKTLKFFFALVLLSQVIDLGAANEHFQSRADYNNLINQSKLRIEDDRFNYMKSNGGSGGTWTSEFTNLNVTNRVYVGTDDALLLMPLAPYKVFIDLEISSYDLNDVVVNTQTITLDLSFSNDLNVTEKSIHFYEFIGYHKFHTKILGFKDEFGTSITWPQNVYIQNEIIVERYYFFDPTQQHFSNTSDLSHKFIDTDGDGFADDAIIYWDHLIGAEEYDLEWTFVDRYHTTLSDFAATQVHFIKDEFEFNATRISTSNTHYQIPLLFDKGFVLYRLRPKGYIAPDFSEFVLGKWSSEPVPLTASHVSDFIHYFTTISPMNSGPIREHDKAKNWQYTAAYAEEGKRKDLITYYDGTLRSRQSVSRINSLNKAIVLESYYNHSGQLAIQSLPTPIDNPTIKYRPNFNLGFNTSNSQNEPYNWTIFETTASTNCIASAREFVAGIGTAKYYGASSPQGDFHDYVPDAEGFPFTQTQYTLDLTGRIQQQAGVGDAFKMGNGHETEYLYSQPYQEELDRLFGYEVGYKSRYKKNMIVDPNGQVSISYVNERGKTIATSLAGANPSNLQVVANEFGDDVLPSSQTLNIDLLNKDAVSDPDDLQDDNNLFSTGNLGALTDALRFGSQISVVNNNSLYNFDYNLSFGAFSDNCMTPKCYPYVYDLSISLKDNCGVEELAYSNMAMTSLDETIYAADLSHLNCGTLQLFSKNNSDGLTASLDVGTYTLSKILSVNEEALNIYTNQYIVDGQANGCILTYQDFLDDELAIIDTLDCEIQCDDCVAGLGPDDGTTLWQQQYNECMAPCTPITPCEATFNMLLADVSPGGQYGSFDPVDLLSVYTPSNILPASNSYWKYPVDYAGAFSAYKDDLGNDYYVVLIPDGANYIPAVDPSNLNSVITNSDGFPAIQPHLLNDEADFISFWNVQWAKNLVYYHPEFCYMTWCWELSEVWGMENYSSTDFDFEMQEIDNFGDAQNGSIDGVSVNFTASNLLQLDPFFNTTHPGFNTMSNGTFIQAYDIMDAMMSNYQGSGMSMQNYAAYAVQCATFYGNNTCPYTLYSGLTGSLANDAWNKFKYLYLSAKQQIDNYFRDLYAIENGCYNGCIGDESFNPWELNFAQIDITPPPPFLVGEFFENFPSDQPCHVSRYGQYENKIKRFYRNVNDYDLNDDPMDLIEDMVEQTDYDIYLQTGKCPLSFDLEILLNGLNQGGNLLATNYPLLGTQEFTYDLYVAVSGIDPQTNAYIPYQWEATPTGNTVDINFTNGNSVCNDISLFLPASAGLNWTSLGSTWSIYSFEQLTYTTGTYDFAVLIKVDLDLNDPDNALTEYVLQGNTCIPIGNCNLAPVNCESNGMTEEYLQLINTLFAHGDLFSTNNISLNTPTYTPIFSGGTLESYLSPSVNFYEWNYDPAGNGTFHLTNTNPLSNSYISVSPQTALPPNIISFLDVVPVEDGVIEITVQYLSQGMLTEMTITCDVLNQQDLKVVMGDCCKGNISNLSYDLEVYMNGYLSENHPVNSPDLVLYDFNTSIGKPYLSNEIIQILEVGSTPGPTLYGNFYASSNQYIFLFSWPDSQYKCSIYLTPINPGSGVDMSLLQSISDMLPSSMVNVGGGELEFTCLGYFSNGDFSLLKGVSKCFELNKCGPCPPPTPQVPITCVDAYTNYTSFFTGSPIAQEFAYTQSEFCNDQYQYCYQDYLTYLDELSVTNANSDYFVNLDEFCVNNYGLWLDNYILLISSLNYPNETDPTFVSIQDFASGNYPLSCIIDYIEFPGLDTVGIGEFCQAFVGQNTCIKFNPIPFPEIPQPDDPCKIFLENVAQQNAQSAYDIYISNMIEDFRRRYIESAISSAVEDFRMEAPDQEYHYTLYYLDQAGNVIRTIPPRGVHRLDLNASYTNANGPTTIGAAIAQARQTGNRTLAPPTEHNYLTTYTYNTLNQLVAQNTPDGGTTKFWYDDLGRLVVSQDAQQITMDQYSYTSHDELGRVVEVGILKSLSSPSIGPIDLNHPDFPDNWRPPNTRRQVIKTYYDEPGQSFSNIGGNPIFGQQKNLRNRIARITYQDINSSNINDYDRASHYSYDELGNVNVVVQENRDPILSAISNDLMFKKIEYKYDLISGNVIVLKYQEGKPDAFYHKYEYDDDNRLTKVYTSLDNIIWQQDAATYYYDHGPIAKEEIGQDKVQGRDYVYTAQGWTKAVNANALIPDKDVGKDGWINPSNLNQTVAKDAFGYSLTYFDGDYKARGGNNDFLTDINQVPIQNSLYNGNIAMMATALSDETGQPLPLMANNYGYDQLNRIKYMQPHIGIAGGVYNYNNTFYSNDSDYETSYTYDPNGNFLRLNRNAYERNGNNSMDRLKYYYYDKNGNVFDPENTSTGNPFEATNQLAYVTDADIDDNYDLDLNDNLPGPDLQSQNPNNYRYNARGQLILDQAEGMKIAWNAYGKMVDIRRATGVTRPDIAFAYDPGGNRVRKIVKPRPNGTPSPQSDWIYNYYVHDPNGQILATYRIEQNGTIDDLYLDELNLYGSRRLGNIDLNKKIASSQSITISNDPFFITGLKQYEGTNHLGNVLAIFSDRKLGDIGSGFKADVFRYSNYFPFGMTMIGREGGNEYRYGFNGMEKDDEIKGKENFYNFGARMHDPRLGRWLSLDPKAFKYTGWSPYNFTLNNPLIYKDPNGKDVNISYLTNENHQEALKKIVATEIGREFIAQFAREGQVIGGVKFDESGSRVNDILVLASESQNMSGRRGLTRTFFNEHGNFGKRLRNATEDDAGKTDVIHVVDLRTDLSIYQSVITTGHEMFIHVNEDVKRLEEIERKIIENEYNSFQEAQFELKDVDLSVDVDHKRLGSGQAKEFRELGKQLDKIENTTKYSEGVKKGEERNK